jgi:hypothetical protein
MARTHPIFVFDDYSSILTGWGFGVRDDNAGHITPAPGKTTLAYSEMPHTVIYDVKRLVGTAGP